VIATQSALIAMLLVQRTWRQRAEDQARAVARGRTVRPAQPYERRGSRRRRAGKFWG